MWSILWLAAMVAAGDVEAEAAPIRVEAIGVAESRYVCLRQKADGNASISAESSVWFGQLPDNALTLSFELSGAAVAGATHFGMIGLDVASDDKGRRLTLHKDFRIGLTDPSGAFVQIDRDMMYLGRRDAPKDRIKVDLKLELPTRDAARIAALRGSLAVKTGHTRVVVIEEVLAKTGESLRHEELEAAGLTVTLVDPQRKPGFLTTGEPGRSVTLEVTGDPELLLAVDLLDGRGETLNPHNMWSVYGSTAQYTLMVSRDLPALTQLKLTVSVGSRAVTVPFAFENLPLP